jgi:hypothetical protein
MHLKRVTDYRENLVNLDGFDRFVMELLSSAEGNKRLKSLDNAGFS